MKTLNTLKFAAALLIIWATLGSAQNISDRVSAEIIPDCSDMFLGETSGFTLAIRVTGVQISQSMDLSGFAGEHLKRVSDFQPLGSVQSSENGRYVETRRFRWNMTAVSTGTIECAPILSFGLYTRSSGMFFGRVEQRQESITVKPFKIAISPLPEEGRPSNFSGAVGKFGFTASVEPTTISAGDVIKITSTVRGEMLPDSISPPIPEPDSGFKFYEPREIETSEKNLKKFEQYVIPLSTNSTKIPPLHFSYFDPSNAVYRTVTEGPFILSFTERSTEKQKAFVPPSDIPYTPPLAQRFQKETGRYAEMVRFLALMKPAAFILLFFAVGNMIVMIVRKRAKSSTYAAVIILSTCVALLYLTNHRLQKKIESDPETQTALNTLLHIAPSSSSMALEKLNSGSKVRIKSHHEDWVRVECGKFDGWIPVAALRQE